MVKDMWEPWGKKGHTRPGCIALFYENGNLGWSDVGTVDDVWVHIGYDEYLKLKKMEVIEE